MPYYALLVSSLLCLHLLAATIWVGGMAVMHFAVRPVVQQMLDNPPQRLGLMAALLRRFFAWVGAAIVVLLASGFGLIALAGGPMHGSVMAMLVLGVLMILLVAFTRAVPFVRLQSAVAQARWPLAASALSTIRRLMGVNLALGVVVYGVALIGRVL
jgi:uncharacterized membrane protein